MRHKSCSSLITFAEVKQHVVCNKSTADGSVQQCLSFREQLQLVVEVVAADFKVP